MSYRSLMKQQLHEKKKAIGISDGFARANYLVQASVTTLVNQPDNEELVRYYMKSAKELRAKKTLKWSREFKRIMCMYCNMLLLPGVTSQVRVKDSGRIAITCLSCKNIIRVNTHDPAKLTERKKKKNAKNKQRMMKKREIKRQKKKEKNVQA